MALPQLSQTVCPMLSSPIAVSNRQWLALLLLCDQAMSQAFGMSDILYYEHRCPLPVDLRAGVYPLCQTMFAGHQSSYLALPYQMRMPYVTLME